MQPIKSDSRNCRIVKMLVVSALILPSITSVGNSTVAAAMECTNPVFVTSDPNGGWSDSGYYVHNNMWNSASYPCSETLYACSYHNWYVVASMNNSTGDGAVKTYPNVHIDYSNVPISSYNTITSTFSETSPHVGIYDVAYDIWTNGVAASGSTEFMIWNENYNQVPGGSLAATATLGGRTYNVYKTSTNGYIAFVPTAVFTSGTLDVLEIFNWTIAKGWLPANSTLGQLDFGVEIVSTNNTNATFQFTDFSITTGSQAGVIKKTGPSVVAKSPFVKNEYYSLSGKRLEFKNGAPGVMKNLIVISRTIDANGVAHTAVMVTR